jgi:ribose-phosphate pyrophosphokinase
VDRKEKMKNINLITQERIKHTLYPDNQPHVNVSDIQAGDDVRVVCPIRNSLELLQLMETANAIDNLYAKKRELVIPYLLAARFDRLMQEGDSIDLKVIADMINSCGFERVNLFDAHSDAATLLIKNSKNHNNSRLVKAYERPHAVLICPDAGAAKKVDKYMEWNSNLSEVVFCIKSRDLSNGKITLKVLEPEKCNLKNCVIIDDICDGGATFVAIAEQIKPLHLTLIVSHGIFSKRFSFLEKHFQEIITSDSYRTGYESNIVKTIKLNL